MNVKTSNPTTQTYTSLQAAYDYFNTELFGASLPPCLITMQRHKGAFGYFSGGRFVNAEDPNEVTDEIALNPQHFATRKTMDVLATLAHEMVHLWQHHVGTPPRIGYHDRQWAAKMKEIGLCPTDTGQPGGRETGQHVSQLIFAFGPFGRAVERLIKDRPAILFQDRASADDPIRKQKTASKTKYTCPTCGLNAWAKPQVLLLCGTCRKEMQAEEVVE